MKIISLFSILSSQKSLNTVQILHALFEYDNTKRYQSTINSFKH
jgi:hypothetical protein